jgi:hypothetical protein
LTLFGGLVTRGTVSIELRLIIGWGAASLVLTLWGMTMPLSLRWPAWTLGAAALGSLAIPRLRPSRRDMAALCRLLVIALPLMLVMLSVRPALPDTFLNLLPNAAYLVDHGAFPDGDRVSTISIFPALPYNQQLELFFASLLTGELPAGGLVHFNIFVQLAFALLLGRLVAGEEGADSPGWTELATGVALATLANPGFMPKVALASMGEPTTEVTLAVAGWFAIRALGGIAEGRSARHELWVMGAVLLAFVNIRQSNVALFGGLAAGLGVLALLDERVPTARAWVSLALAMLPAALFYAAWRLYVLGHFQAGELKLLPVSAWRAGRIPEVLTSMGAIALHRSLLFVCLTAAGPLGYLLWRRGRQWTEAARALALVLLIFVAFNAFLVFAYVVHFGGADGEEAHSYFRYNSHLSLLMMLAFSLAGRELYRIHPPELAPALARWMPRLLLALTVVAPVVFLKKVRFDLAMPQPVLWDLSRTFAERLKDSERVALVAPGDNGTLLLNLRGYLALTRPRRSDLDLVPMADSGPSVLRRLSEDGFAKAIVTCAASIGLGSDLAEAVLLERGADGWAVTLRQPYRLTPGMDWMAQFPIEPFCGGEHRVSEP